MTSISKSFLSFMIIEKRVYGTNLNQNMFDTFRLLHNSDKLYHSEFKDKLYHSEFKDKKIESNIKEKNEGSGSYLGRKTHRTTDIIFRKSLDDNQCNEKCELGKKLVLIVFGGYFESASLNKNYYPNSNELIEIRDNFVVWNRKYSIDSIIFFNKRNKFVNLGMGINKLDW